MKNRSHVSHNLIGQFKVTIVIICFMLLLMLLVDCGMADMHMDTLLHCHSLNRVWIALYTLHSCSHGSSHSNACMHFIRQYIP